MPAPISVRVARVLGDYTRRHTAYELWAEFLYACRDGYVPTLSLVEPEQVALGVALESQDCKIEWRG